jgi:transposase InsO family protein
MKLKQYAGSMLRVRGAILPGAARLARVRGELSKEARRRLQWIDWYHAHGKNARKSCRHFSISPDTFYRWLRRYDPQDLSTLESRSRRPKRRRQPTWSFQLAQAVLELRERYPRWGKDKLVVLLRDQGVQLSASMVGRILTRLKAQGSLREPLPNGVSAHKHARPRPYAIRKPREYEVRRPGDLVQVDTLDVRPLPGMVLKHFTARDMVSRWDVLEAHRRATAQTARGFLKSLLRRMPFAVRALQVDGGSEFHASFEEACQQQGIHLFVLPPRSPKLNGCVERAQRTHTEEFYQLYDGDLEIPALNQALLAWEHIYNTIRPHQALGYLTPSQFLAQLHRDEEHLFPLSANSHIPAKSRPETRKGAGAARGP